MEKLSKKDQQDWLQKLAAKSWHLELSISGAATFIVSYLPNQIERGFDYYLDNLAPDTTPFSVLFPLLAYAFFKVMAWMLFGTFIYHLCLRALWVGVVGLHAAFPAGITYSKIPYASDQYRQLAERKYGSLIDYVKRLDERCNKVYALALLLAMGLLGLGLIYLFIFGIALFLRQFFREEDLALVGRTLYWIFLLLALVAATARFWMKWLRAEDGKFGMYAAHVQLFFTRVALPLFSKPIQYMSMTFMSNVDKRLYMGAVILVVIGMVQSGIMVMVGKLDQMKGTGFYDMRNFYSSGDRYSLYQLEEYDNQRPVGTSVPRLTLSTDVVGGGYFTAFVKYPRAFDLRIEAAFPQQLPADSVLNSLPKERERAMLDSVRISCLNQFFQVVINDSIPLEGDWMFMEKYNTKGLIRYINASELPSGKNRITVYIPTEENPDSTSVFATAPFWVE